MTCSLCNLTLHCQTTGGNWNPTYIPARAQEGRKRPLTSSSAHANAEVTEEPEQGSPHQLHYHCQRISSQHFPGQQGHSATGILFWKLETQESVWGATAPVAPPRGWWAQTTFPWSVGQWEPASPSAQPNPHLPQTPAAENSENHCIWFHGGNTRKIQLLTTSTPLRSFSPLLHHALSNSIYFLFSFQ